MPNREYLKGARAERELMASAIEGGATAYRGAGSHGAYDVVISTPDGYRYLVNIKCNNWAPPAERYRLAQAARGHDVPVLARKRDRKGWDYRSINGLGEMGSIIPIAPWQ